jgi:hypothetical protein
MLYPYTRISLVLRIPRTSTARALSTTPPRLNLPSWPPGPIPQSPQGPDPNGGSNQQNSYGQYQRQGAQDKWYIKWANSSSFQAALTTIVGLGMVFGGGIAYLEWYKHHVLHRVS